MEYLYILKQALIWVLTAFWCYQFVISLCALVKLKDKPYLVNKNHKFMAIIPAHNEEMVVANLIESLKNQTYDKNLYDIYVIADNCTDKTAEVARKAGAIVYERFDNAHKTKGYALFYWTMHRMYHLARYNIGLSPLLNGTGFMVKFDVVKPNGWETQTLTEDIEFSLKQIIQGRKLGWATDAIVYDEQPTSFKQSWSQRSRWTVGHMQCLKTYTGQLYKAVKEHKTLMNFDGLLYIAGTTPILVVTFGLILINCIMYVSKAMTTWLFIVNILNYLIPTLLFPIFTALFVMVLEKKPIKPMIKGLLCYPAFMGTWVIINLKCLFKRETTWEKIEHVRDIKIAEVKEEEVPEKI